MKDGITTFCLGAGASVEVGMGIGVDVGAFIAVGVGAIVAARVGNIRVIVGAGAGIPVEVSFDLEFDWGAAAGEAHDARTRQNIVNIINFVFMASLLNKAGISSLGIGQQ
jgi:hypothetical protein